MAKLTYLSPNTVKSSIRTIYRKSTSAAEPKLSYGVSNTGSLQTTIASNTGAAAPELRMSTEDTRKDLPSVRLIDRDGRAVEPCEPGGDDLARP